MSGDPSPSDATFRPVASRGSQAVFTLKLFLLAALVSLVGDAWLIYEADEALVASLGKSPAEVEPRAVELLGVVGFFAWTVSFVIAAVCFLRWKHRAYANLPALGSPAPRYSPGWTVGSYFVPILNLFRPYRAMKDVHNGTLGQPLTTGVPAITRWWVLWLITWPLLMLGDSGTAVAADVADLRDAAACGVASQIGCLLFTLTLLPIVISVTEAQTNKAKALGLAIEEP